MNNRTDPLAGEWLGFRRDNTLQARSPLKGRIRSPRIAWKHLVGRIGTLVTAEPSPGISSVKVPGKTGDADAILSDPRWGLVPAPGMIAGRLQPNRHDRQTLFANIVAPPPALDKVVFESGFDKPAEAGQWAKAGAEAFTWNGERWETIWKMDPIPWLFYALPLAGDFDGDGKLEIAFFPWRKLVILDAATGRVKDECEFLSKPEGCGRVYGFAGAYDLDGDGKDEIVVVADFSKHLEAFGYREGKLALLWQREVELDIFDVWKVLRRHPDPVADVDGDGALEVVVSIYNDTGDGRWHVYVHDGPTGRIKADVPDELFMGLADADGDGMAEVLTARTEARRLPPYGGVRMWNLAGGSLREVWSRDDAEWQLWPRPYPDHTSCYSEAGREDVLWRPVGGKPRFVLRGPGREGQPRTSAVSVESWKDGGLQPEWVCRGRIRGIALDASGALLLEHETEPNRGDEVTIEGGRGKVLVSVPKPLSPHPPVVAVEREGARPTIVVPGNADECVALRCAAGGSPEERWRRRGSGQVDGLSGGRGLGMAVADLAGDGRRQLLYACASPEGGARLAAMSLDGVELWHRDMDSIPAPPTPWNCGGVLTWQTGRFRDARALDVLVCVRRSITHSEEAILLSGRDGSPVWHRKCVMVQGVVHGVGGTPFAVADFDADGLDEAVSLCANLFYALDGVTGEPEGLRLTSWPEVPGAETLSVYWGVPVAVRAGGKPAVFFGTERRSLAGLVSADGDLIWWDARDAGPRGLPAFGDFLGSGGLQAVAAGYEDGIRCHDVETGKIEWRLDFQPCDEIVESASADLDSDGRDEALFAVDRALYCVGMGTDGKPGIRWRLDFPGRLSAPCIADVEGNGSASILVTCADGSLYCVR